MISVRDLISTEFFTSRATLVAGETWVDGVVREITVMEAPDFQNCLSGGEFILSTFFSVKDDVNQQIEMVHNFVANRITALGIKTSKYVHSLDPRVIEVANSLNLPLFIISETTKFQDLIRFVSKELLVKNTNFNQDGSVFQEHLISLTSSGQPPETVCKEIESYIGYPCAILTSSFDLLAGDIYLDAVDSASGKVSEGTLEAILDELAFIGVNLNSRLEFHYKSFVIKGCFVKDELVHFLIFSQVKNWDERDSILAKHAAKAVALSYLKRHIEENTEKVGMTSFVSDLIFKETDYDTFIKKAQFFGWKTYDRFQVVMIRSIDPGFSPHALEILGTRISNKMNEIFPSQITISKKDEFIIFTSFPSDSKLNHLVWYKKKMNEIQRVISYRNSLFEKINIGIGTIFSDYIMIKESYHQALTLVENFKNQGNILYADEHLLELFLLHSKSQIERKIIESKLLNPLQEYDQKHGSELLLTIKEFIKSESLDNAASSLFIHPNTLRNRLMKITEITGVDPNKTSGRLMYMTALIDVI